MDITGQAQLVIDELLKLIDQGKSVSVADVADAADQHNLYEFIKQKFVLKNVNGDQELIKSFLNQEACISETDANKVGIWNNGLVYLVHCLLNKLENEAFDNKCNGIDEI